MQGKWSKSTVLRWEAGLLVCSPQLVATCKVGGLESLGEGGSTTTLEGFLKSTWKEGFFDIHTNHKILTHLNCFCTRQFLLKQLVGLGLSPQLASDGLSQLNTYKWIDIRALVGVDTCTRDSICISCNLCLLFVPVSLDWWCWLVCQRGRGCNQFEPPPCWNKKCSRHMPWARSTHKYI